MPIAILAAVLLLAAPGEPDSALHERLMSRVEQLVRLPDGAHPLGDYARVYTMLGKDNRGWAYQAKPVLGRPKVLAIYSALDPPAGRRWESGLDLPTVMDGGCGVVTIVYDIEADRIDSVDCNSVG
jgi:hypothetical protein